MNSSFLDHMPSCSETDESCKKQMERLLNIWKERSLYRADYIQQLKLAIEDNNSPIQRGNATENVKWTMNMKVLSNIFKKQFSCIHLLVLRRLSFLIIAVS